MQRDVNRSDVAADRSASVRRVDRPVGPLARRPRRPGSAPRPRVRGARGSRALGRRPSQTVRRVRARGCRPGRSASGEEPGSARSVGTCCLACCPLRSRSRSRWRARLTFPRRPLLDALSRSASSSTAKDRQSGRSERDEARRRASAPYRAPPSAGSRRLTPRTSGIRRRSRARIPGAPAVEARVIAFAPIEPLAQRGVLRAALSRAGVRSALENAVEPGGGGIPARTSRRRPSHHADDEPAHASSEHAPESSLPLPCAVRHSTWMFERWTKPRPPREPTKTPSSTSPA